MTKLLWFLFGGIFGIDHSLVNTLPGRNKSRCPDNGKITTSQSANFHFQAPVRSCWKCSHVVVCQSNIAGLKTDQKMGECISSTKCERCTVDGSEIRFNSPVEGTVVYSIIYRVLYIPSGCLGFLFFINRIMRGFRGLPPKNISGSCNFRA